MVKLSFYLMFYDHKIAISLHSKVNYLNHNSLLCIFPLYTLPNICICTCSRDQIIFFTSQVKVSHTNCCKKVLCQHQAAYGKIKLSGQSWYWSKQGEYIFLRIHLIKVGKFNFLGFSEAEWKLKSGILCSVFSLVWHVTCLSPDI